MAQYMTAFEQAFASRAGGGCGCGCESGALCRGGKCQAASCGTPTADTLPACTDSGGQCWYAASTTCNVMGPLNACAYSDEVCCLIPPFPPAGEGTGADSGTCTTDADCGSGDLCGFPELSGCSAVGTCFPKSGAICDVIELACACDGTSINIACNGLPSAFAPKPFAHSGVCGLDAGSSIPSDASAVDSSAD